MASLNDIVTVTISQNTRTPSRAGFGTALFVTGLGNSGAITTVTELSELVGLETTPLYRMTEAAFSQNPRPARVKTIGVASAPTHTQEITITSAVEGAHVKLTVESTGTIVEIDYTILAAATTTTVATAVELLVEAVAGVNSTSAAAVVTATAATPGFMVFVRDLTNCTVKDVTVGGGYNTALTAALLLDPDFYFVAIDMNSETNVDLVAAWAEANKKIFIAQTSDTGEKAGTGTLLTGLEALTYDRTGTLFVEALDEFGACAWIGRLAPLNAGAGSWKFKELAGVTKGNLTTTQETAIIAAHGNFYADVAGLGVTIEGWAASGEFLDITHGTDAFTAELKERVFTILANADKVPYTDASVDMFVGVILATIERWSTTARPLFRPGTATASGPLVADVLAADRAARLLPDLVFGAEYAGAVHKVSMTGTLSV